MTRVTTVTAAGDQAPTERLRGSSSCAIRRAARVLLCSSVLAGGLLFLNLVGVSPAYAVACTGALDGANATLCPNGSTADTLTYVVDNPAYTDGNFTLTLDGHDVTGTTDGITFEGLVDNGAGENDGFIELEGDSDVRGNAGNGITSLATDGSITINVQDTSSVSGSASGIVATTGGLAVGNITITTEAATPVVGEAGDGISAVAQNIGNVIVNAQGAVTGTGGDGIDVNTGDSGTINVTTGAAAVLGTGGSGIEATAEGNVTVGSNGNVTGSVNGIDAVAQSGGVNVTTNGVAGTLVNGTGGDGINAAAVSGAVIVNAQTAVTGSVNGIDAHADTGALNVTTGAAAVIGQARHGIDATAEDAVTVETDGFVIGFGGHGILAQSTNAGNVIVTTTAGVPSANVFGWNGAGINASTTGIGTITITNDADALGSVTGIEATSGGGNIQITNNQGIANMSLNDADLAIRTTGGATTIDNNSQFIGIVGRVETGGGADVFNHNQSSWYTEGTSDFGAGIDTVNNMGVIVAGNDTGVADTTTFANLETLDNKLYIALSDQLAGDGSNISDTLTTSGKYNGNTSTLTVDAFLGAGGVADVFTVGGSISGVTQIFVTDTNAGTGALNLTGILVVDVNAAGTADATNFVLGDGPIDKGLFVYDLLFDDANNDYLLVGLPDRELFEAPAAVAGSQEIWRETADAWSTRQENLRDTLSASYKVTAVADPGVTVSDAPMGSLWVSALGSWSERDNEESFSILNANLEFNLGYSQDIYGVVGGADFGTDIGGSSRLLFGVMAGYVDSSLDFDEGGTSIDTGGATVGAYAALLSNGFFATVLVKGDFLNMDYSTADDDDSADVTTIGARGDLGYRFGHTLFVEPMLSVDGMSTDIEEFTISGADIDAGTNESFRAGAGLRLGYGGETIRASATARVWDVFATDNEVDIGSGGSVFAVSDDDLEGVYGDVSGQIDINLTSNTTFYLKGGVLFSDDVTKPNASGGFAFYW